MVVVVCRGPSHLGDGPQAGWREHLFGVGRRIDVCCCIRQEVRCDLVREGTRAGCDTEQQRQQPRQELTSIN